MEQRRNNFSKDIVKVIDLGEKQQFCLREKFKLLISDRMNLISEDNTVGTLYIYRLIIGFFLLYEGIIGYVKGIRMVLFDIVKFIGSWLITVYKCSMSKIVSLSWFQSIVEFSE